MSHIRCCHWSSQWSNKASRNLISEIAVAACFITTGNLVDVSKWGVVSETNFAFCWCTTIAATTTATTTAAPTTTAATTTTVTMSACTSDITTIPSYPSQVFLSSTTLSELSRNFFSDWPVRLLQEAVETAAQVISLQSQSKLMLHLYDLSGGITDAANCPVTWLPYFVEWNLHPKTLKYMLYCDFLQALGSSGRVMKIIKQHH